MAGRPGPPRTCIRRNRVSPGGFGPSSGRLPPADPSRASRFLRRRGPRRQTEDEDPESREGRDPADPHPRRVVRHEGALQDPDALEGPHEAREKQEDPEDDEDETHRVLSPGYGG